MILQSLNDYYGRLLEDPGAEVPQFGFGVQGVHYCLTIDKDGNLVGDPLDLRDGKGKPKRIEVPGPVKRTVGVSSNFAWDNTGYVLGIDDKDNSNRTLKTHAAFKELILNVLDGVDDEGAHALRLFLQKWKPEDVEILSPWNDIIGLNLVFRLEGETRFLHDRPAFRNAWIKQQNSDSANSGMCLVTGNQKATIPATHASIKGVPGAQSSGAALISFNFESATSLNKKQNFNAPISEHAAFAYTTALNKLLAPGSERKIQVGDTTVVFWTEAPCDAEPMFGFAMGGKQAEDSTQAMRLEKYLPMLAKGKYPEELGRSDTPFYILGLSPNAARLSVRFWHVGTVGNMAANLGRHYRDLSLNRSFENEPEYPSPWWLLKELAPQRDSRNISPLLSGQLLKAVIHNRPYPRTLLTAALGRIRADKQINYLRAAIIKAFLVRNQKQEILMTLDKENTDIGYRLGRLFALVERIQEEAVPGANATVKDRFFSSASATPARTFPLIIRNTQHGLAKIRKDKPGWAVTLEKGLQEILGGIEAASGFPTALGIEAQGTFILGYYQQRQDLFTKKEMKIEE